MRPQHLESATMNAMIQSDTMCACGGTTDYLIYKSPNILWLHYASSFNARIHEYPRAITVVEKMYEVRGFLLHRPGHFYCIFKSNDSYIVFDNITRSIISTFRDNKLVKIHGIILVQC